MPRPAGNPATSPRAPRWGVALLLAAGAALFAFNFDAAASLRYLIALPLAAIALTPPVSRTLAKGLEAVRTPSPHRRYFIAGGIFILSAWYLLMSASLANRGLYPKFHDEHMYLLQARMLAEGKLWLPQHELADFFDSFFVIVRPVYASSYFPGTALMYVPGMWLGIAPWLTAAVITAAAIAMLFLVVSEMIDAVAGFLAALLAVSLEFVRVFGVMTMSHLAFILLLLVSAWIYLRWRHGRRWGWALAFGVVAGWSAITRPLDAVCLVFPLAVGMLWDLRRAGLRRIAGTIGIAAAGAVPFLGLQLVFDKHLTGHWLKSPITMYGEANLPGLSMGFGRRTQTLESKATLPQVRDYYRQFHLPQIERYGQRGFVHAWLVQRWLPSAKVAFPVLAIWILLPVGLLGLCSAGRVALASGVLTFALAYTFFSSFLEHYALVAVPAFIFLAMAGLEVLGRRLPIAWPAAVIAVAALCAGSLPEVSGVPDRYFRTDYLADINEKLARLDHLPAVVLFRYESNRTDLHQEPVYNLDTAWPDDALVIRAHDLGPRNHEIFAYYAKREPQRFFYRYDRTTAQLAPLGWAGELARQSR